MEKIIIKFGIKAYLFSLPFILIIIGFDILFYFLSDIYFYYCIFITIVGIILWLYYFLKMNLIVTNSQVILSRPFYKKIIFPLSEIKSFARSKGKIFFYTEEGKILFYLFFYMDNIKEFIQLLNKD